MVAIPNSAPLIGIPRQSSENLTRTAPDLFISDVPLPTTQDRQVAPSQNIPAWTPVGLDNASGLLVPALWDATTPVQAIGITVVAVVTDADDTTGVPIYRTGSFNVDALNWPASFDTDAKKFGAFEGAPSPTQITLKRFKPGGSV